ncbi:MAG: hypothetical protein HQL31_13590, partial [Planctomycetes bacterium]|nr:hypothetical protein [Planctomycetota bacterium]
HATGLRKAGCTYVWMGVECGDQDVARTILERNLPNTAILEACARLRANRIKVITQNLIGLPVKNPLEVDLKTLDLNIAIRPHYAWSSILYPYPATKIGAYAFEQGYLLPGREKVQVSNKSTSSLDFKDEVLRRKIVNLHKLFGVIVQFPFLRRHTDFLITLPLTRVYTYIFFLLYGYKLVWCNASWKERRANILNYAKFFFSYVSRLEKTQSFSGGVAKDPSASEKDRSTPTCTRQP